MMRKVFAIFLIGCFALVIACSNTSDALADETYETCNEGGFPLTDPAILVPLGGAESYQTFQPSQSSITQISAYIMTSGAPTTVDIGIKDNSGSVLVNKSVTVAGQGWYGGTITPLTVTVGNTYKLYVDPHFDINVIWARSLNGATCYANGAGYLGGGAGNDFYFIIFQSPPQGPTITSLSASAITTTSANIYWATANQMSTSIVNYGTTTAYGSTRSSYSLVNSHLVSLSSLSPGTTYHYKVTSTNGEGVSTESEDNTFSTESDSQPGGNSNPNNGSTTTTGSADVNANVPTAAAVSAASVQKAVDESIAFPTLTSVTIGTEKTNAPIANQLQITSGFVMIIDGKSFANATVALTIGDKAFVGTANKDGVWQIAINSGELAVGDATIKAQAQDTKKNKGSKIVDLFNLKINPKPADAVISTEAPKTDTPAKLTLWQKIKGQYKWYAFGILIVILAGLGVGSYFFIRRLRSRRKIQAAKTTL